MDTLQEIIQDNARGLQALKEKTSSFSQEDLLTPMEAGWTVAAVLAHLSFWDLRAVTLIEKWTREGVSDSPMDTDVVNEATRGLCLAIAPDAAVKLVLSAAERVDDLIAGLTPEMIEAIQTRGKTVRLNRADHRRTHLGEIEKALQNKNS